MIGGWRKREAELQRQFEEERRNLLKTQLLLHEQIREQRAALEEKDKKYRKALEEKEKEWADLYSKLENKVKILPSDIQELQEHYINEKSGFSKKLFIESKWNFSNYVDNGKLNVIMRFREIYDKLVTLSEKKRTSSLAREALLSAGASEEEAELFIAALLKEGLLINEVSSRTIERWDHTDQGPSSVTDSFSHKAGIFRLSSLGLYADNRSNFDSARNFLEVAYQGRLGITGDLTITALKRLDPALAVDLENEFANDPDELRALLPNPTERADAKLLNALGYVPTGVERQKALTVLARGGKPGLRGPYKK